MSTTCSGCCASSRPPSRLIPAPVRRDGQARAPSTGVIYFGSTTPAHARGAGDAGGAGRPRSTPCACAASRSPTRCSTSSPRTSTVFVVEQNRDGQLRTLIMNEGGVDPAKLVAVCDYDGTPITARFIAGEIAGACAARPARRASRPPNDLHHQAPPASPAAADQRARLHPPRLRGLGLDPLRRLRPRLDLAPRSSRPATSSTCRRTGIAKLSGIGCSSKTPDYFLGNCARLQHRARTHALGAHRRQPGQQGPDLSRRLRRRRFRLDRPRPVRPLHPARRQHGLHRREQRRVRPDQGPVLRHLRRRLEVASAAWSTTTQRSTWSAWRCSWARPSSPAASPATRTSSRR